MNVKLLRKVATRIKRHAARFNLRVWGQRVGRSEHIEGMLKRPPCKTQACIAGETLLAARAAYIPKTGGIKLHEKYRFRAIPEFARELLGLDSFQANTLFKFNRWSLNQGGWPQEFQTAYENAKTPAARAKVAAARIEHFIKTEGRE